MKRMKLSIIPAKSYEALSGHLQKPSGCGGDCDIVGQSRTEQSCPLWSAVGSVAGGSIRAMPMDEHFSGNLFRDFREPDAWLVHGLCFSLNKLRFSWHLL